MKWRESKTIDLRREVNKIFEDVITTFLYGKNVKNQKTQMKVIREDGTVYEQTMTCFQAIDTCLNTASQAMMGRLFFGDQQVTQTVQISFQNWENLCQMVDSFVV